MHTSVLRAAIMATCLCAVGIAGAAKRAPESFALYQDGKKVVASHEDGHRVFRLDGAFTIGIDEPQIVLCVTEDDLGQTRLLEGMTISCLVPPRSAASSEDATELFVGPDVNNALNDAHGLKRKRIGEFRYQYIVDSLFILKDRSSVALSEWNKPLYVVAWVDDNGNDRYESDEVETIVLRFD